MAVHIAIERVMYMVLIIMYVTRQNSVATILVTSHEGMYLQLILKMERLNMKYTGGQSLICCSDFDLKFRHADSFQVMVIKMKCPVMTQ